MGFFGQHTIRRCFFSSCQQAALRIPVLCLFILLFIPFLSLFSPTLHIRPLTLSAQTIPVDDLREEQLRMQQLLHGSELSSFTNRPVWRAVYDGYMDLSDGTSGWWNRRLDSPEYDVDLESSLNIPYHLQVGVFEPELGATTNSRHPHGRNNGAAWYGKGINSELQGGVYITSDYVTAMVRPHIVWQQNTEFVTPRFVPLDGDGNPRFVAEAIGDRIDRPYRFGPDSFWTADAGHSSIRIHYDAIEAGFGNDPLWWGGNVQYPLVMSNNAPGMRHVFLGTRRPLRIPWVGALEFRWMGGWPEDSDYFDQPEPYQRSRFMNAANISLSPAFAPSLHIGLTRTYHTYIDEGGLKWSDIFVLFDPYTQKGVVEKRGTTDERKERNEINSLYARWVWPEGNTEIYGEFYREDYFYNWRDFLMEPRHNSGYAFGFQSLISAPLATWYRLNVEFTNMTPSFLQNVRPQNYYYTHDLIRQGHTNRGQLLGAAIGPGSNSQYLGVDALTENGRVGIFIRRLADNNHFHYEYDRSLDHGRKYGDYWRHRTDLTVGGRFMAFIGPFNITGQVSWTRLYNYGRFDYGVFGQGVNIVTQPANDLDNIQMQLSVRYLF